MAYNVVSTTKNAVAALRYGEHEQSVIRGGVDCPPDTETACRLFAADRIMWNKDNGLQAHILIQSFEGQECSPEKANKIGQELARRVAPGHRAMVYTHRESEGGNVHNHIIVSAINHENGRKLDGHGLLYRSRHESDEICREHGLSVIKEHKAELRYTMAEKSIINKGGRSWKDDIRDVVDEGKRNCRSLDEFTRYLRSHGITIHERSSKQTESGKQWTFYTQHEGKEVRVRAAKLGEAYSLESIQKAVSIEKVSVLEKANELINNKVRQVQEKEKAAELEQRKAVPIEQQQTKVRTKTIETGWSR